MEIISFFIEFTHDRKKYRYNVVRTEVTKREEIYELTAKNKTLRFTNNRPFLLSKNLKHWKPTWKMEGDLWNKYFQELIIKAIEEKMWV